MSLTREEVIRYLEQLSSDELSDFVEEFRRRVGLPAPPEPPSSLQTMGAPLYEDRFFEIKLIEIGSGDLVAVIKRLRELSPSLGLAEARELVQALPRVLPGEFDREEAERRATALASAGARVELVPVRY